MQNLLIANPFTFILVQENSSPVLQKGTYLSTLPIFTSLESALSTLGMLDICFAMMAPDRYPVYVTPVETAGSDGFMHCFGFEGLIYS